VYGNVFYNVYRAILLGGGRDTIIQNNIFINNRKFLLDFASSPYLFILFYLSCLEDNIYIDARGLNGVLGSNATLVSRYDDLSTTIHSYPWNATYPDLPNLLKGTKQ
jgi:hypothetical protein